VFGCIDDRAEHSPSVEGTSATLSADSGHDWRMAAYDSAGTGHNASERSLKPGNVGDLEVKWTFDAASAGAPVAPIHAIPVVAKGKTFVGSYGGRFYAIGRDGELLWSFDTQEPGPLFAALLGERAPVVAAAVLPEHDDSVVFGDIDGRLYKLDRQTGSLVWTVDLDDNDLGGIWGNSLMIEGDTVYVGLASFETLAPFFPERVCCTHRGAVVAINLATGETKWRYDVISQAEQGPFPPELVAELGTIETFGPSGGDVWSQPTYDARSQTVFASTGQLFSRAPDGSGPAGHDAIIALDARSGQEKWVRNLSNNIDVFRFDIPFFDPASGRYFDKDMSDQPKVHKLRGRTVVGAGQKSGEYHVLDARTGAIVSSTQHVDMIIGEGGFQSGGAVADRTAVQHGVTTAAGEGVPYDGIVMGLSADGVDVEWEVTRPGSPLFGSVAMANGVVYFQSPFEEGLGSPSTPTWALFAIDAKDGAIKKRIAFEGSRAVNGPVVSRGRVYAGFGNAFAFGLATPVPEGGVVCLGLDTES
jgi:polyvinyl alcohol dehydrogenase (cytochrome)